MFKLFRHNNLKTIACIGDSITFGTGVIATRSRDSYPAILNKLLGPAARVFNYGIGSRTLLSTGDFPYIKERMYQRALRRTADIYIIMLGTNDSKPFNWDEQKFAEELPPFVRSFQKPAESSEDHSDAAGAVFPGRSRHRSLLYSERPDCRTDSQSCGGHC